MKLILKIEIIVIMKVTKLAIEKDYCYRMFYLN